jgi:predicted DNA-binding protein YlxM (UPF0122 family)
MRFLSEETPTDRLMSVTDIAARCGVSTWTIHNAIKRSKVKHAHEFSIGAGRKMRLYTPAQAQTLIDIYDAKARAKAAKQANPLLPQNGGAVSLTSLEAECIAEEHEKTRAALVDIEARLTLQSRALLTAIQHIAEAVNRLSAELGVKEG